MSNTYIPNWIVETKDSHNKNAYSFMRKCDKTTLISDLLKLLTNERISVAVGDKLSTLVVRDTGSPVDFIKKIGDLKI